MLEQVSGISIDDPRHSVHAAMVAPHLGRLVKPRNGLREGRHQAEVERVTHRKAIEERLLVEPAHLNHPVDGRPRTAEGGCPSTSLVTGMTRR